MTLNALVIDDHPEYRALLKHHITAEWPDAYVVEYDPEVLGQPDPIELASAYDIVLLDHLPAGEDGLRWLENITSVEHAPPVIFFTAKGDELMAAKAIKHGAHDYIPKVRLSNSFLVNSIKEAIRSAKEDNDLLGGAPWRPKKYGDSSKHVSGFNIMRQIWYGKDSEIYLARREADDQQVAVKIIPMPEMINGARIAISALIAEQKIIETVKHPNVVNVFEHGFGEKYAFIVMEFLHSGDLKSRIRAGLPEERAIRYVKELSLALEAIHSSRILHRDLKPSNVMFREDDSLVLIDFGLARHFKIEEQRATGEKVFGTPYYMSPEQSQGQSIDQRGDLYSLGIMFFEMLTGRKPFTAASPKAVLYKQLFAPPPRLSSELSRFQPIIDKLLEKDPALRFQHATEVIEALDAL